MKATPTCLSSKEDGRTAAMTVRVSRYGSSSNSHMTTTTVTRIQSVLDSPATKVHSLYTLALTPRRQAG